MYILKKPLFKEDWWVGLVRIALILFCIAFFVAIFLFPILLVGVVVSAITMGYYMHKAPVMSWEYETDEYDSGFLQHVQDTERLKAALGETDLPQNLVSA
ncbi:MAG TPA: hypothetical protein VLA04_04650 [Verrucomicrobiae bacterium]|nr:hypothetical protein [Verrucomicrobiae bacterium]